MEGFGIDTAGDPVGKKVADGTVVNTFVVVIAVGSADGPFVALEDKKVSTLDDSD